jgi:hypothetical protein
MYIKANDFISKGNKKLPPSTWIFNCGSATECPSMTMGLCQVAKSECYAWKAERQYPMTQQYRDRQTEMIKNVCPIEFAVGMIEHNERCSNKMELFRFNESGDFLDQEMVSWMETVCIVLSYKDITSYGYTARTDLDLTGLIAVAGVNVSNDLNDWQSKGANRFKVNRDIENSKNIICGMDCTVCSRCSESKGLKIDVPSH